MRRWLLAAMLVAVGCGGKPKPSFVEANAIYEDELKQLSALDKQISEATAAAITKDSGYKEWRAQWFSDHPNGTLEEYDAAYNARIDKLPAMQIINEDLKPLLESQKARVEAARQAKEDAKH
ncbi:MAG TPA: hypothetical protein VG125_13950 [Pirellulales bacterium]|jgi:hypothetical protein|nr:hypothetical protein [Pirellulales bacterium]